jgi:hypothetical protein
MPYPLGLSTTLLNDRLSIDEEQIDSSTPSRLRASGCIVLHGCFVVYCALRSEMFSICALIRHAMKDPVGGAIVSATSR